jgi:CRP/FNR family cyclic AMP-dependent transcriptional regulator
MGVPPTVTPATLVEEMAQAPLLDGMDRDDVARLTDRGAIRRYRRGTYLFHQGDDSPDVFFLIQGRVELSSLSANGHRQLHTTLDHPQFFGELGVLGDMPRTGAGIALEESTVWRVSADAFLEFLTEVPAAALSLLRVLARQVQSQEAFVEDLLYLDLKGRVAKRLLQLVAPSLDELPNDGAIVPSIVTHADLASLCGGSRENVTRILSDLQRRGFVEREGRRFVLRNIAGLARLAAVDR